MAHLSTSTESNVPDYLLDTTDGFLCQRINFTEVDSGFNHDALDWLTYILKKASTRKSSMVDVFGSCKYSI